MAGCDHAKEFEKIDKRFEAIEKRLNEGDSKFEMFSNKFTEIFVRLEILPQLNTKLEKVIDNSGFSLKQLIGYGITFALGVLGTIIAILLKGGGTP